MSRDPLGYRALIVSAMPGTRAEIEAATGIEESTVVRWLRRLQDDEPRGCHVRRWLRPPGKGPLTPVYAAGPGKDAPNPGRLGDVVYSRNYRKRIRGTEVNDNRLARQRAKYWADKATQQGDPLVQALFGARAPQHGRQG